MHQPPHPKTANKPTNRDQDITNLERPTRRAAKKRDEEGTGAAEERPLSLLVAEDKLEEEGEGDDDDERVKSVLAEAEASRRPVFAQVAAMLAFFGADTPRENLRRRRKTEREGGLWRLLLGFGPSSRRDDGLGRAKKARVYLSGPEFFGS